MPEVIERDATGAPVTTVQSDKKEETVTLTKSEVDAMKRELGESRESEKYWANLARNGNGRQTAQPETEPDEEIQLDESEFLDADAPTGLLPGDTPEKFVDELAKNGVEAFRRRGFISKADAEQIAVRKATEVATRISREVVGNERQKLVSDNQLLGKYPDLRNPESELFKETAKIYREAVEMDPRAKNTPATLLLAAKAAKQILDAKAPTEDEEDRLARINAQDGRTRGRQAATADDLIGPEAQSIIKAMGISEEDYKAEKTKLSGTRPVRRAK